MKKSVSVLLCLLLALVGAFSLTGCGKSGDLYILMMANDEQDAFYEQYFKEMGEELGIKIDYKGVPFQDYFGVLKSDMSSGQTPDLFYIRPGNIKSFVSSDMLMDLTEFLDTQTEVDFSELWDNTTDIFRYDGTNVGKSGSIYAVNLGFNYSGLGYNKKLVQRKEDEIKAAGYPLPWELGTPDNPATYTFEQLLAVANICKDSTGGGLAGEEEVYGMSIPQDLLPFIYSYGGDILTNGEITVNTEAVQNALTYVLGGIESGAMDKSAYWSQWMNNQVAFFTEVASFEINSYSAIDGFEYDMMPYPTIDGGENWYGTIMTSGLAISKKTAKKDIAQKIALSFLSPRTLDRMLKGGLVLPLDKETATGGYIDDNETYRPDNKQLFIDVITGKKGKFAPEYFTTTSEWLDTFNDNIDKVWNKTETVAAYTASMQAEMSELYQRTK